MNVYYQGSVTDRQSFNRSLNGTIASAHKKHLEHQFDTRDLQRLSTDFDDIGIIKFPFLGLQASEVTPRDDRDTHWDEQPFQVYQQVFSGTSGRESSKAKKQNSRNNSYSCYGQVESE